MANELIELGSIYIGIMVIAWTLVEVIVLINRR